MKKTAITTITPPKSPIIGALEPFQEIQLADAAVEGLLLQDILSWPTATEPRQFDGCKLERCSLVGESLPHMKIWDSIVVRTDLSAARCFEAGWLRSEFIGCRLSGMQLGESVIKDCLFQNCKLTMLSLRSCKLERVVFKDCVLDEADFTGAELKDVVFASCELRQTVLDRARCSGVDMTASSLANIRGVMTLKGVRIRHEQIMELAPLLCAEVGFVLADESSPLGG